MVSNTDGRRTIAGFAGVVSWLAVGILVVSCAAPDDGTEANADVRSVHPLEIPPHEMVIETEPLRIDRILHSMQGPADWEDVDVSSLGWITGYKAEVLDALTGQPMGDQFFCHSQIQQLNGTRLFVNATGVEELRFPQGFGMPVSQILSGLPPEERKLEMFGMVLNNHEREIDRSARIRVTLDYYTEEEVGDPPKLTKLYQTGLPLHVNDIEAWSPTEGPPINEDVTTHCALVGDFNGHWVVPPGEQKVRQVYTDFLPVDGTVHFIMVHLHNYGVYMRLTDVTTGELLWQAAPIYQEEPYQIVEIPLYSSETGFPVYKDHEYEIEALYHNTTDQPTDAMAQMSLFYHPLNDEDIVYPNPPS